MSKSLRLLVLVSCFLLLAALAAPARAQTFIMHSGDTITPGDVRLTAYPVGLFGRNGGPDRWGGGANLGYGITDYLDVEGQGGFFNGFSLVGLDANIKVLRGDIDLSTRLGAHKALVTDAQNSTAFDLGALLGGRVSPRLRVSGGVSVSFESLDGVDNSGFTRAWAVPGLELRINRNVDFVAEGGVGLNDNSPHYVTAGFAVYMPTSDKARDRR
jgi:hypothetical protein